MSLSTWTKREDVRGHMDAVLPDYVRTLYLPIVVAPGDCSRPLVGTAFDYALRFELQRLRPDAKARSKQSQRLAFKRALRKWLPYYAHNYLLFPLLAGPSFLRVLLGNWLAETMRDFYSAATIYCGHVGEDVASWPLGTRTHGKGEWYAMQVMATNNFEVSKPVSILCGGLDLQIEHHLFPQFPPERLREIAPEVRAICAKHGVPCFAYAL